jgi:2-polyprenyl-6-methoxyphenol hydroxylase-like FAD-dependent oxidoreductase
MEKPNMAIFIGADGSNSKVRESLWKSQFYSVAVHEIVGISKNRTIPKLFRNTKAKSKVWRLALFQLPVMNRFGLCNMMSN